MELIALQVEIKPKKKEFIHKARIITYPDIEKKKLIGQLWLEYCL